MNPLIITYALYLPISIGLTVWVGRTLHRHGRIFLVDACAGNQELADSINHLLIVGFYLVNFGFVTLYLRYGMRPETTAEIFEALSARIGVVLLVLGGMHFFNLYLFNRMRKRAQLWGAPPPVPPTGQIHATGAGD
ncbi:hypothetical protein [Cerasicoccus arenae]|uniref:Uncharacterized protein n=1 Tax=Cerasicoccus arenae TaxID=424488 RepID=A0A8J3DEP4_9BACT|nr:hypothetical protein [Cerasicoccus arenae]MBK1858474.1 hypothetical protein [Cerasicoccus arenae]GHC10429.1 hypothetical protein GCM10007047_29720 [Cerasicoccus arenae]